MIINNTYSNDKFTGAFRIKPIETLAQKEIPELFTQGRQVFNNIIEEGDEFIVVRNNYDKRIAKYITENNLKDIEYYPDINTSCHLDSEQPEGLLALLKNKSLRIITDLDEMMAVVKKQKKAPKPINPETETEKIANALRLHIENPETTVTKNFLTIRDNAKQRTISVVMQDNGNKYVYVRPDSSCEETIKCFINKKGEILHSYETPKEIHKFFKHFQKAKSDIE